MPVEPVGSVVVGVGGPTDGPVIAFAFTEAARRHATLQAVHVWTVPADTGPAFTGADHATLTSARQKALRTLHEALDRCSTRYPDVPVVLAVRHSLDVAVVLTAAARSAQLVVIGSPRGGARDGPALGAIGTVLVNRSACPVAMVPRPAPAPGPDRPGSDVDEGVEGMSGTRVLTTAGSRGSAT